MHKEYYKSLPKNAVLDLKEQRASAVNVLKDKGLSEEELEEALTRCHDLYFGKFDDLLDNSTTGQHWIKQDNIAQIWTDALKYFDEELHSLKSYTSNEANKALNRTGAFWTHESYDRVIRGRVELQAKVNGQSLVGMETQLHSTGIHKICRNVT